MKKRAVAKKYRQKRIILLSILILISSLGVLWSYFTPLVRTEERIIYPYQQQYAIDYSVNLKDNNFFLQKTLPSGMAYITDLTETINTDFTYQFAGENEADIHGDLSVIATLTAKTGSEGHIVLEQEDELLAPQSFSVIDNKLVLEENVVIPFQEYLDIANNLKAETRFNPSELNLIIKYKVDLEVETEDGIIRETLAPTLELPLQDSTFIVGGTLAEEYEGGLKENQDVSIPLKYNARKVFPLSTAILVLILLYYLLWTFSHHENKSPAEKEVSSIMKKNGDRIVCIANNIIETEKSKSIVVNSFADLLKLADELDKPIIYFKGDGLSHCIHSFLVISQGNHYVYCVEGRKVSVTAENKTWRKIKNESGVEI